DYAYFTVAADGTISYDAALDAVLTGAGTSVLTIRGASVTVDAGALEGTYLALDYVAHDPASAFSARLLPGQHWLKTYGGDYLYFTVTADGAIDYDAALDGALTGRGTTTLGVVGRTVTLDTRALGSVYLSV